MQKYDVAIIGAGVVGCAIARELSMYSLNILLLEKGNDVSLGASKANSGIVHGGYDARHGTLKSRLSYAGNRRYSQWESELSFGFEKRGSLVLAFDRSQHKRLLELKLNGEKNGVPDLELLKADQVKTIEPGVNPAVYSALHAPHVGICSPYELTVALAENAVANGVDLRLFSDVVGISKLQDHFRIRTSEGRSYAANRVINTAGLGAGSIAAMVGIQDIHIRPRKGQYLLFRKGTGDAVKHVLFQVPGPAGKGILVTSTYHGNLMIGPNAQEVDDSGDTSTDLENLRYIYEQARISWPEIQLRDCIRSFSGLRAGSADHDFIIRHEDLLPGFFQVAGIDSPGLTAAPAIADMVIRLLADSGLELLPDPEANRYRKPLIRRVLWQDMLPMKEANRLTQLEYGDPDRIVCRCEQVREAEIRESLQRGIRIHSTDAVKRRTRAGMGMCQGNFCASRVTELIAQEYGIDPLTVSQRGYASAPDPARISAPEIKKSI
ncbi:FAD-dependent oxidoreductase [Spirochaeta dissipatitropha]